MLTNSQHVTPAGPAIQEDAVKSEETDIINCALKSEFKSSREKKSEEVKTQARINTITVENKHSWLYKMCLIYW